MQRPSNAAILISAATAFSLLGDQVLYSVLPVYFDVLGLSPIQVGIVLSANRWIRLVTNQLAHVVAARFRSDVLFVAALVLGALTTFAYTESEHFSVLLAARLAWGLAWSFIRHVGVVSIMADVPEQSTGRIMGYYNGISRIGSVAGLFGGALLVDLLGYQPALVVLALVSLTFAPIGWVGIRHGSVGRGSPPPRAAGTHATVFMFLGVVIGAVGSGFVMATLGAALDFRLGEFGGLSAASVTGALLAVRFVLDSAAAPWLGAMTDRFGPRLSVTFFMAVGGLALLVAAQMSSAFWMAGFTILFFIAGTALHAGVAGIASARGSGAFARFVTALDFGAAVGPLAGWVALDIYHIETIGLSIGGVIYAATAIVAWFSLRAVSWSPAASGERQKGKVENDGSAAGP